MENLGAKFFDIIESQNSDYQINTDTLPSAKINFAGYFAHGFKLKSYNFDKYKSKKRKNNKVIYFIGKNKPSLKEQVNFKAIEEGTFYARDLVSEPGNVLHPDEYARRLGLLKKDGLKVNIYDEKEIKKIRNEYIAWCWPRKY